MMWCVGKCGGRMGNNTNATLTACSKYACYVDLQVKVTGHFSLSGQPIKTSSDRNDTSL